MKQKQRKQGKFDRKLVKTLKSNTQSQKQLLTFPKSHSNIPEGCHSINRTPEHRTIQQISFGNCLVKLFYFPYFPENYFRCERYLHFFMYGTDVNFFQFFLLRRGLWTFWLCRHDFQSKRKNYTDFMQKRWALL